MEKEARPKPQYEVGDEVKSLGCARTEPEVGKITAVEWLGKDPDDYYHIPSWYYQLDSTGDVWHPEVNIDAGMSVKSEAVV